MTTSSPGTQLPPTISFVQLLRLMKNPIGQMSALVNQYPDAFRLPFLPTQPLLLHHPAYVKHVLQEHQNIYLKGMRYGLLRPMLGNGLLLSEGDFWRKQRLLTQPAFHKKRLELVAEITMEATDRIISNWKDQSVIDFTDQMGYLTIEIVSKALFGADVGDKVNSIRKSINMLNEVTSFLARLPLTGSDWVMQVPYPPGIKRAIQTLDDTIYGIIRARRTSGQQYDDLLSMLMEATYEDTGASMTDQQLRDEMMTLFIAGHETTVIALSWTAYLLTQHPEAISKIRAELKENISTRYPTFADLPKLKYLTHVINESLRLYPPVYFIARRAIKEDMIGPYKVETNRNVGINIYGLHRHPAYWDRPNSFVPERFENFDIKGDHRFLFLPFGGGPRTCIGNNFAMMEMQIIISILVQQFNFELSSPKPTPLPQMTLKPSPSVCLKLTKV